MCNININGSKLIYLLYVVNIPLIFIIYVLHIKNDILVGLGLNITIIGIFMIYLLCIIMRSR